MTLLFIDHTFQYEIERLFRAFFPPVKIRLSNDIALAAGDYCLTRRICMDNSVSLLVQLCAEGGVLERSALLSADTHEKEQERVMSVLLYGVLSEFTGAGLPWGILTGVRPIRLLSGVSDDYALNKLLVSPEKLALARKIDKIQAPALAAIPKNSYSLYISIPFCPSRCSYCSFVSHSTEKSAGLIDEYVDRLTAELVQTSKIADECGLKLDAIYIGGGTPTTLSEEQLKRLFSALEPFDRSFLREFTVEAGRPDTISREKLNIIKRAGARRVSVNPQTMNDSVLEAVGRRHSAADAVRAYELAREAGFNSINMDLIAGLPTDTPEGFRRSLDRVIELAPENITVHSLSLKRAARLFHEADRRALGAAEMIEYTHETLAEHGYIPYYLYRQKNTADNQENTGYSKPGAESLYNMFIMEEAQTVLACGAGASTKLVDSENGRIKRIVNFKYPYEYLDRFDKIEHLKREVIEFFV